MVKKRTKVGKFLRKMSRVFDGKPAKETDETRKKERIEYCKQMGRCSFEEKKALGMYIDTKGVKTGNTQQTKGVKNGTPQQTKGIKNGN